jgi:outer membrane protein assembly factor BamD (BamD/ComL family)
MPDANSGALPNEASVMATLRGLQGTNPPLTLRLARETNARYPGSPDAPERAWMIVKALVNMEQFTEAREEARIMVDSYPNSSFTRDVRRHLLSNPL